MASRRVAPIPPKGNGRPLNVLLSALRTSKDEKEKKLRTYTGLPYFTTYLFRPDRCE